MGAKTALNYFFGRLIEKRYLERADLDACLASDTGIDGIKNRTIFRLSESIDWTILHTFGFDAVHAPLVIEPVVVGCHEGPEQPFRRLPVVSELLNATVRTSVASGTIGGIK
jgi:hypothetical protein